MTYEYPKIELSDYLGGAELDLLNDASNFIRSQIPSSVDDRLLTIWKQNNIEFQDMISDMTFRLGYAISQIDVEKRKNYIEHLDSETLSDYSRAQDKESALINLDSVYNDLHKQVEVYTLIRKRFEDILWILKSSLNKV